MYKVTPPFSAKVKYPIELPLGGIKHLLILCLLRQGRPSNVPAGDLFFEISRGSHAAQFWVGRERIDERPYGKFVVKGQQQSFVAADHLDPG